MSPHRLRVRSFVVGLVVLLGLCGCGTSPASNSDAGVVVSGCGDIDGVDTTVSDALSEENITLNELTNKVSQLATNTTHASNVCGYVIN